MDCVRGQIMRSLKGHDKGDFQVVLKTDGAYAYMADGKRRRMEAPKKKKLISQIVLRKNENIQDLIHERQYYLLFLHNPVSDPNL